MKKYSFKIVIVLVLLVLSTLLLFACADKTEEVDTSADTAQTTEGVRELALVEDNQCARVVYGANATEDEIKAANSFAERLMDRTGWYVFCEQETQYSPDTVEIAYGSTDYPESREAFGAFTHYGQSVARVVGNKLVIAAAPNASYGNINTELVAYLVKNAKGAVNMNIPEDFELKLSADDIFSALPIIPSYTLSSTDAGDGCHKLDFSARQADVFNQYVGSLTQKGFELYASNSIEGNDYATYVSDKLIVTSIHTAYNDKYKLLVESRETTGLPTRAEDNKYTPISGMQTTLTQIGCFYDVQTDEAGAVTNFNGMSYAIRLCDGSFIVVDGGHGATHADNLYKVLSEQSPNPDNIVIAAWFFSHDHGDHLGFFPSFAQKYAKNVTVEQFVYNFPSASRFDFEMSEKVRSAVKSSFAKSEFIKAHPGQVFCIRDVKITMLFTVDIYELELKDTNNASMVWQLEFADKTTFTCFGDYAEYGKTILSLYSAKTLKSDIVQVAHHGMWGQDSTLYEVVQPTYAFWPAGAWYIKYEMNNDYYEAQLDAIDVNKWFFEGNNIDRDNIFLASDDICIMTIEDKSVKSYENLDAYIK